MYLSRQFILIEIICANLSVAVFANEILENLSLREINQLTLTREKLKLPE